MNPVRLALLGGLLYIAYRLLVGVGKKKRTEEQTAPSDLSSSKGMDILVEDPVCHTLVPREQACFLRHNNQSYYFCSDTCCQRFLNEKGDKN